MNARTLVSHAAWLQRHFHSLTAESELPWERTEPAPGDGRWQAADRWVAFAAAHGMGVRAHTRVRHEQTPD